MQPHLVGSNFFSFADVTHHLAGQRAALALINLPADDLATKNIHKLIQVKVDAKDPRGQIDDVPAE